MDGDSSRVCVAGTESFDLAKPPAALPWFVICFRLGDWEEETANALIDSMFVRSDSRRLPVAAAIDFDLNMIDALGLFDGENRGCFERRGERRA